MYELLLNKQKTVSVTGLGYVGLPIALELARHFRVIGFDLNAERIALMQQGIDPSRELDSSAFEGTDITFTTQPDDLRQAHFHIIAVPTDVDDSKVPNLSPLQKASASVGRALKAGDYVVYESTVYPGCTEEDCLPILEAESGLRLNADFKLGYSPERIVPGDKVRTLTNITKVVSGSDAESRHQIARVYGQIIKAGIFEAASIKVAEAAKVIENTQRDLNISLMNELSMIFDKMGIDTHDVLEAAGTKWNFLKFYPGLVGGHCIGVDPYYLLHKSRELGYDPQVILSGRRINDEMPAYVAKRLVQLLLQARKSPAHAKVLVLGITFKEDVSDIRNSRVAKLIHELMSFSIHVHVMDPYASANEVAHEYNLTLVDQASQDYDGIVAAVAHETYRHYTTDYLRSLCRERPVLVDIKGMYPKEMEGFITWRL